MSLRRWAPYALRASRMVLSKPSHTMSLLRPFAFQLAQPPSLSLRYNSTSNENRSAQIKMDKPELMIAFTCKKCDTRSSHVMSKQAYTSGTVLITCPGCNNRHLIADHLKIFSDERITIQDILGAKGESVSQNTDDLIFDEIPDKLKGLLGHHAKDSPNKGEQDEATPLLTDSDKK